MGAGGPLSAPDAPTGWTGSERGGPKDDINSGPAAFLPPAGRVCIIDPQTLFRKGLAALLRQWNPRLILLDAGDAASALAELDRGVALVLIDAEHAAQNHFAVLRELAAELPAVPVVLLTSEVAWDAAAKAFEIGARGYVPKCASDAVLRHALGLVLSGKVYLPREILARWADRGQPGTLRFGSTPTVDGRGRLTPRQLEVLAELALGQSNKAIARSLGLLEGTVKVHVKTILKKLSASNRTQAARIAIEMGLAQRG